jgi:hypothetical protein
MLKINKETQQNNIWHEPKGGEGPLTWQIRAQSCGEQDQNQSKPSPIGVNTHRPNQEAHRRSPTKAGLIWA